MVYAATLILEFSTQHKLWFIVYLYVKTLHFYLIYYLKVLPLPSVYTTLPKLASLQWLTLMDSLWRANSNLSTAALEDRERKEHQKQESRNEAVTEQVVKNRSAHPWLLQNTVQAAELTHGCLLLNSSVICHYNCYTHTEFSNSIVIDKTEITHFTAVIKGTFPMPSSAKLTSKVMGRKYSWQSVEDLWEHMWVPARTADRGDKVPFSKQHSNSLLKFPFSFSLLK